MAKLMLKVANKVKTQLTGSLETINIWETEDITVADVPSTGGKTNTEGCQHGEDLRWSLDIRWYPGRWRYHYGDIIMVEV